MVKGCERRVVVYKANDSKYFLEAHFFLKPEVCGRDYKRTDMLEEANRIIRESCQSDSKNRKKGTKRVIFRVLFFLLACVLSSGVTLFVSSIL